MKLRTIKFNSENILFLITIFLILLSLVYFLKGFYNLTLDKKGAQDLFERWKEQQYIYQGQYPYDVGETIQIDPKIGFIHSGGYPPWAFFTGFLLVPPIPWDLTRIYYALLNFVSLVILALFSFRLGSAYGQSKAWFSMAASLAISSHTTTLNNGQFGIIINALLIVMFWLLKKHRDILAGLVFGLAMIKPNISALYIFALIVRRRVKALLSFSFYIVVASTTIWIVTKLSPIYMIGRNLRHSTFFAKEGYSLINIFINLGIDTKVATFLSPLLGLLIITIICYLGRNYSLLTLFAIASFIGRIWTYHRVYDNLMLIFLLFALLNVTLKNPQKLNTLILTLLLITLWLPARMTRLPYMNIVQMIIWAIALGYLIVQEQNRLNCRISHPYHQ